MPGWRDEVKDEEEGKVLEALADRSWDYRSIDGLERSTGLAKERIQEILDKYNGSYVRKSTIPDTKGRTLYALKTESSDVQEGLAKLRIFASKSAR